MSTDRRGSLQLTRAFAASISYQENHLGFRTTPTTSRPYLSTSLRAAEMLLCVLKGRRTDEALRASLSNVLSFQIQSQQPHRAASLQEVTHQWCQLSRTIHHTTAMAAQCWNPRQHINFQKLLYYTFILTLGKMQKPRLVKHLSILQPILKVVLPCMMHASPTMCLALE
ncbi:uncharacterized protein LOC125941429 [Dermacentor silvarum]|uniref:uncharacterized protein LOC125941429 n=1 Tax=Dermacentor silvarum TaxID=543639 RepID=UPI00210105A3|nr:uncharacterized protein LOC125941429 [Dermacentor silvarum]